MRRIIVCSLLVALLISTNASNIKAQTVTNADLEFIIRNLIQVVDGLRNQLDTKRGLFDMVHNQNSTSGSVTVTYTPPSVYVPPVAVIEQIEEEIVEENYAVVDQIAAPDLLVISPRQNAVWNRGVSYAISWSMRDLEYPEIRFINKATGRIGYSVRLGRSSTRYVWQVPLTIDPGVYMIQITAKDIKTGDLYLSQSRTVLLLKEDIEEDSGFEVSIY